MLQGHYLDHTAPGAYLLHASGALCISNTYNNDNKYDVQNLESASRTRAYLISYTGKLCHRGKCHSGNCHSGERWMSRPFVHSGNLNFKHTLTNDFGLPQCLRTYHLSLYNIKKDMLLTGPSAMLSMPLFDFHFPPCTEGFLIHLSPLWQLPLWQLPVSRWHNFPVMVNLFLSH